MIVNRVNLPDFDDGATYVAIKGATLNKLLRAMRQGTPLAGKNILLRPMPDGVVIDSTAAGSGTGRRPLELYQAGEQIGVWPGGVSATSMVGYAGIPSFGAGIISGMPLVTPPDDATTHYYLDTTWSDLDLTACDVSAETSPTDTATHSYLYCGSVTVADGVITSLAAALGGSLYVKRCASDTYVWGPVGS